MLISLGLRENKWGHGIETTVFCHKGRQRNGATAEGRKQGKMFLRLEDSLAHLFLFLLLCFVLFFSLARL